MRIDSPSAVTAPAAPVSDAPATAPDRGVVKSAPASPAPSEVVDAKRLDAAIEAAHQFLHPVASNLRFVKDDSSGRMLVQLVDSETQKVLRQMPSEEMLAINKALDRMQGLMVHLKV